MADTVRLRNISDQDLHVPVLGHRLVKADCAVEIPAKLLHHQPTCSGVDRSYDEATGTWAERACGGCQMWPEQTWKVESAPKGGSR